MTEQERIQRALSGLHASGDAIQEVLNMANQEKRTRRIGKRAAIVALAAVIVLALGVTAFASSGVVTMVRGSSTSYPNYTSLPTEQRAMRDAGYVPVLPEAFGNGYAFRDGYLVSQELMGHGGEPIESYKEFDFTYEKDGDRVTLEQAKYQTDFGNALPQFYAGTEDGVDFYFHSGTYKAVPVDYEPTAEEEAAVEQGALSFGYGADEVETRAAQTLFWQVDDMHFGLFQWGNKLTQDELIEMAKEVIAQYRAQ